MAIWQPPRRLIIAAYLMGTSLAASVAPIAMHAAQADTPHTVAGTPAQAPAPLLALDNPALPGDAWSVPDNE